MSDENVETLHRVREAWDADDLDAFLAETDPDAEWNSVVGQAFEGSKSTYRGHAGLRRAWDDYRGGEWTFTSRIEEIRDLGESVLLLGQLDLSSRTTGAKLSEEFAQHISFRAGKVLRSEDFLSHADALEAVGLPE